MRKFQFKIDYLVDIILKKKLRLVTQIQIGATKNIQIQLNFDLISAKADQRMFSSS